MRRAVIALMALTLLAPGSVGAATKGVKVEDDRFAPRRVAVRVGDVVHWTRAGDSFNPHNVHQSASLFRSGAVTPGRINFRARFSSGTFPYLCQLHASVGMRGVVRVPAAIGRAPAGLNFSVRWANGRTNTGNRFDVQYRIGSGKWRGWRTNTRSVSGVFGKGGRPVRVVNGKRYSIRARSQKKRGESGWSPVKSFRP